MSVIGPSSPNGVMEATMQSAGTQSRLRPRRSKPATGVLRVGEITTTSRSLARALSNGRASTRPTSRLIPRLLAWYDANTALSAASASPTNGGRFRMASPSGGSTLTTSHPRSARSFVQ